MLEKVRPRLSDFDKGRGRHIHFVGIGGIGMSSIASILLARGFKISGSDVKENRLTQGLSQRGAKFFLGHKSSNLPKEAECIVYSTSINEDNPELVIAKRRNIPVLHRSDIVVQLVNSKIGIAITGSHGKTTTTALSALLLTRAGLDPTVIVGGEVSFLGGNWRDGKGDYVVCEADESDGTFRSLRPSYAILTNIDREHLEHYKAIEELIMANKTFIENIKKEGVLLFSFDDPHIKSILKNYPECSNFSRTSSGSRRNSSLSNFIRDRGKFLTYSMLDSEADIYSKNIRMAQSHSIFEAIFKGRQIGLFELNIPGRHNVENSLAVILLGLELGIEIEVIKGVLLEYKGVLRRFEVKADIDDIMVIEDYAHHPTEIMATITACRNWPERRLVGIFQPHRYTRTKFLKEDFGKSFLELDELILTDIYSASEKPIEGVTTRLIYDEAVKNGQRNVHLIEKEKILSYLLRTLKPKDMVLVLGAGDIGELSDELVRELQAKRQDFAERATV